MANFVGRVATDMTGSEVEFEFNVDDELLDGKTDAERAQLIEDEAIEAAWNHIECSWCAAR